MIVDSPAARVETAVAAARRFVPLSGWGAFVFVVLFWRLGADSFWDPDEAHYAETTRELLASGDWLAPYYNDQPFFDKPILFHVLQAIAMAVFGVSEFAARLVPALAALALVGVTAAPWFVCMWWRFGDAFIEGYVLNENVRLFSQQIYSGQPGPWFYFQVLAAGLLPWTGLVIGRLIDDVRRWWSQRDLPDTTEVLLWAWTAAVVGFFTLSKFKLDHYVFPVAPALCLLCARAWSDLRVRPSHWANAGARVGLHLVGPLLVAVGLGGGYFLIARLELPAAAIVVPAAVTLAGAFVTARLNIWAQGFPGVPWIVMTAL